MFRSVPISDFMFNPPTAFGKDWMVLAAGTEAHGANAMTIAWGQMGALWSTGTGNLPVVVTYVRPSRFTYEFMEREPFFSLSYFGQDYRKELGFLGSKSGRDFPDKITAAGLTPVYGDSTTYIAEAEVVIVCRKIYRAPLDPAGFLDPQIVKAGYADGDYHVVYVGEILKLLVNEDQIGG